MVTGTSSGRCACRGYCEATGTCLWYSCIIANAYPWIHGWAPCSLALMAPACSHAAQVPLIKQLMPTGIALAPLETLKAGRTRTAYRTVALRAVQASLALQPCSAGKLGLSNLALSVCASL